MYIHVYIYIYVYIHRERERERDSDREGVRERETAQGYKGTRVRVLTFRPRWSTRVAQQARNALRSGARSSSESSERGGGRETTPPSPTRSADLGQRWGSS